MNIKAVEAAKRETVLAFTSIEGEVCHGESIDRAKWLYGSLTDQINKESFDGDVESLSIAPGSIPAIMISAALFEASAEIRRLRWHLESSTNQPEA